MLETKNNTAAPVEAGLAATFGIEVALEAFLKGIAEIDYDSISGNADDPVTDMSWMWQYCSEYGQSHRRQRISFALKQRLLDRLGFYQRGDPENPLSIETSFQSLELFQQECNSTFPEGIPLSPQVQHVDKYGGWNMTPSNVLFTNGECEPSASVVCGPLAQSLEPIS